MVNSERMQLALRYAVSRSRDNVYNSALKKNHALLVETKQSKVSQKDVRRNASEKRAKKSR